MVNQLKKSFKNYKFNGMMVMMFTSQIKNKGKLFKQENLLEWLHI